jgi:hypothetical protein
VPATDASAGSEYRLRSAASACWTGNPRGDIDHLLGQRQAAMGVDHQVSQLFERFTLGVELAVGLRRGDHNAGE